MTRSNKAMLLSALLFPGSGLFLLRKPGLGALLAAASAVALYLLLSTALTVAGLISAQILRGEIAPEISTILAAVHSAVAASGAQANLASLLFMGCWAMGMVLTYRASERDRTA